MTHQPQEPAPVIQPPTRRVDALVELVLSDAVSELLAVAHSLYADMAPRETANRCVQVERLALMSAEDLDAWDYAGRFAAQRLAQAIMRCERARNVLTGATEAEP